MRIGFGVAVVLLAILGCRGVERPAKAPSPPSPPPSSAEPQRPFYPIMPWELPPRTDAFAEGRNGLKTLADCGFTVAAFVRPAELARCRELGMKAMLRPASHQVKWREITDAQIEQHVRELVAGTERDPTVLGYFLTDEPGVREFPALGKAVAAVKRLAPGKLAYINLFPNYATLGAPDLSQLGTSSYLEYLQRYVAEVKPQFISYDNYQVQYSQDLKNAAIAASYFTNLMQVRQVALEHGLPFWNIVSSNQIRPGMPPPSPANLLLQAYTTLAAGGQCVTWYTYFGGGYRYSAVEKDGARTATWSYLRMVNEQVRVVGPVVAGLKSTGVYFSSPALGSGLPALPGQVVQGVESSVPMMLGEFSGTAAERWAMIVNLSLERSAKAKIKLGDVGTLQHLSPVDGRLEAVEGGELWLSAGQGALLKATGPAARRAG